MGTSIRSIRVPNHLVGPFESEEELNEYLIHPSWSGGFESELAYQEALEVVGNMRNLRHRVVFTHGDLQHHNYGIWWLDHGFSGLGIGRLVS